MNLKTLLLKECLYLQGFGKNPEKYASLGVKGHIGIDINFGYHDNVPAFSAGTCVYVNKDQGTVVIIDAEYEYSYAHLDDIFVNPGDKIECGTAIGIQGSKGATTAESQWWTHLHFGVRMISLGRVPHKLMWDFPAYSPIAYHILNLDNGYEGHIDPTPLFNKVVERVADIMTIVEASPKAWNNPGNLRWSPFQTGTIKVKSGSFATFDTPLAGRTALIHQLSIAAKGLSAYYKKTGTVTDFTSIYAPASDSNTPLAYAKTINTVCGFKGTEPISDWMLNEIEWIKKYNNPNQVEFGGIWTYNPLIKMLNNLWGKIWKS